MLHKKFFCFKKLVVVILQPAGHKLHTLLHSNACTGGKIGTCMSRFSSHELPSASKQLDSVDVACHFFGWDCEGLKASESMTEF